MPDNLREELADIIDHQEVIEAQYRQKNPRISKQMILEQNEKYRSLEEHKLNIMQMLQRQNEPDEEPESIVFRPSRSRGKPQPWDLEYWKI